MTIPALDALLKRAPENALAAKSFPDLKMRFISALALIGIFALALYSGFWGLFGFVSLLAAIGLWEIFAMAKKAARFKGAYFSAMAAVVLGSLLLFALYHSVGALVFLGFIMLICMSDMGAYFGGRIIGGPKIFPRISPNKTWAGAISAIAASTMAAALAIVAFGLDLGTIFIAFAPIVSIAAQAGDFAESALKRTAGIKDSSAILPGHGGVLDRLDGVIGAALICVPLFLIFDAFHRA